MSVGVVIAAGGTAGHVYPGLALADAIRRRDAEARITFVGTSRGIEKEAVPAAGYPLHLIEVLPWSRALGTKRLLAPVSLASATVRARSLLQRLRPDVVVGMGAYASLPVLLAAWLKRMPSVLHEQNAAPGIANIVGSRVVRRVALTFGETRGRFPGGAEVRVIGNPIRDAVATLDRAASRADGIEAFELDPARRTVLFMGGSLGAARLNATAAGLFQRWGGRLDLQMLVSAGPKHGAALRDQLAGASGDLRVRVVDYFDRVELAYAAADVAVCRAGAATVAELAAVGLPSILVPYPYARANHQEANARSLERAGGARVILDAEADASTVGDAVESLLADAVALDEMVARARAFGRPHAADDLGSWALALAGFGARDG